MIDGSAAASQSNVPITFGQVFKKGDIPAGSHLVGTLGDGSALPLQVDVKATHDDGSLRHAVISAVVPALPAGKSLTLYLSRADGAIAVSPASPQALLDAGFKAGIKVTINGQVYTASADELLKSAQCTTWLAGPIATEWLVSAPLKAADNTEHPQLSARFAIRYYPAAKAARVDMTVENGWAYGPAPQNVTYDAEESVGGQVVYAKTGLTHYHHARWRKVFWWGTQPVADLRHDTAYLIATKAVPNYDQSIQFSSARISAFQTQYTSATNEPMETGLAQRYMPTTGGRPDIGLLPAWQAAYLLTMDKGLKAVSLASADLAGSWPAHYRDKSTGRPVSPIDYPYITTTAGIPITDTKNPSTQQYEKTPACGGDCSSPNAPDTAHSPEQSYLPYLVTGDYYYLDELQLWAMWNLVNQNPAYRSYNKGLIHSNQVRGQAWALRTLADAAYITPDNDPLKTQFETFLSNNLDWYKTNYVDSSNPDYSLGFITEAAIAYGAQTGIAPWMDDFFTSAVGYTLELGYSKALPVLQWKVKFPIGRMVAPGFCWILGSNYSMNVRDSSTSPIYTSMSQVYQATVPAEAAGMACNSPDMATALGRVVGDMAGYSGTSAGYPSNMQPALAFGATWGGDDGKKAWQQFMLRTIKPDYSTGPQFDILPR